MGNTASSAPSVPSTNPATINSNRFRELINKLLEDVKTEIEQKDFSVDDFRRLMQNVEEAVARHTDLAETDQLHIVKKVRDLAIDLAKNHVSEEAYLAIAIVGEGVPAAFSFVRRMLLEKFDLNGDGKISPQECAAGCGCAPPGAMREEIEQATADESAL